MASSDENYVCMLTEKSLEKAKKELNEDPKNRLGAVETFRSWVLQQPHYKCQTDTATMLRFLRYCKFSQLEARKRLDNYLNSMNKEPEWIGDVDVYAPKVVEFFKLGYIIPLPGFDSEGRRVILIRMASFDPKTVNKSDMFKACMAVFNMVLKDENTLVNGIVYIMDMSNVELKHQTYFSLDDMKRSTDLFQNSFPVRLKGIHYYNIGVVAETLIQLFLPFLKKKYKDRLTLHGNNMESVYRVIPKDMLPEEYLPDDYTGKSAGKVADLIDNLIKEAQEPEMARYIAETTNTSSFGIDESKRPKDNEPQASFRKLNID